MNYRLIYQLNLQTLSSLFNFPIRWSFSQPTNWTNTSFEFHFAHCVKGRLVSIIIWRFIATIVLHEICNWAFEVVWTPHPLMKILTTPMVHKSREWNAPCSGWCSLLPPKDVTSRANANISIHLCNGWFTVLTWLLLETIVLPHGCLWVPTNMAHRRFRCRMG